jgi:hypothetical protein
MVPYDIINADEKFDIYPSADKMPPVTYQFTYLALLQDILLGVAGDSSDFDIPRNLD